MSLFHFIQRRRAAGCEREYSLRCAMFSGKTYEQLTIDHKHKINGLRQPTEL